MVTHLQTVHGSDHRERDDWNGGFARGDDDDEVDQLDISSAHYQ